MDRRISALKTLLRTRVAVLDGGLGTLFQSLKLENDAFLLEERNVTMNGNFDVLNLTRPGVVAECHRKFLMTGDADIIETNTFNSNLISQIHYLPEILQCFNHDKDHHELGHDIETLIYNMARSGADIAVSIAREVESNDESGRLRFVAGSVGPTGYSLALQNSKKEHGLCFSFSDFVKSYVVQMKALLDAQVDIILIETVFDSLNCKAALVALHEAAFERKIKEIPPLWISATLNDGNRTLAGQTCEALWHTVKPYNPLIFGFNCSMGPQKMLRSLSGFFKKTGRPSCFVAAYPNKGMGDDDGLSPEEFSKEMTTFVKQGLVNVVGGCCGTTPDHISALSKMVRSEKLDFLPATASSETLELCGLDDVVIIPGKTLIAGERCSVPGSRVFKQAVITGDWSTTVDVARQQLAKKESGFNCSMLDVCMDDAMIDSSYSMKMFLQACSGDSEILRVPIVVDSSNINVVKSALSLIQGKALVNSISLKEGDEAFVSAAMICKSFGAAVVVMACDEHGPALNAEDKILVCKRAFDLLTKHCNYPPDDIVFDLNVMSVGTGVDSHANYAVEFLHALRQIKEKVSSRIHTIAGISNVSFAFRSCVPVRRALNSVLFHEAEGFLDIAIVNPTMLQTYDSIPCDLLERCQNLVLNKTPDATVKLTEYCMQMSSKDTQSVSMLHKRSDENGTCSIESRILESVTRGNSARLKEALELLIAESPSLGRDAKSLWDLIDGPLMEAMKTVGKKFASGELFLPQVLRSSEAVQEAIKLIQKSAVFTPPADEKTRPVVILATVKGDVHDIGKNIVGTVISSAVGVRIIDLGTMCTKENIVSAVLQNENVCALGLSGLINPSLAEMGLVLKELQQRNCTVPVLIGGAATSSLHTAVRLAPLYPNSHVIHARDASAAVPIVRALVSESSVRDAFLSQHQAEQTLLQTSFDAKLSLSEQDNCFVPMEYALAHRSKFEGYTSPPIPKENLGVHLICDISVADLIPRFDWKLFFHMYDLKGESSSSQQTELRQEALKCLDSIAKDESVKPRAVVGLFRASRTADDDIEVLADGKPVLFYCLRQQHRKQSTTSDEQYYSLSDFVNGFIGVFAVTMGDVLQNQWQNLQSQDKVAEATLLHSVSLVLAECLSSAVHERVMKDLWMSGGIQSIRPAFGYPCQPDHSEKLTAWRLLDVERACNIKLTETFMMAPEASCSGLIFCSPNARYFSLGKLSRQQKASYTARKHRESIFRAYEEQVFFPQTPADLISGVGH